MTHTSATPKEGARKSTSAGWRWLGAAARLAIGATVALFLTLAPAAHAAGPPTVTTTDDATAVTTTSATVAGTVNPNSSNVTDCHVDYGTSAPAYGFQQDCASLPGSVSSPVDVHADLTGLDPYTVYHFRVVATNGGGTVNGVDRTFVSDPGFPASTLSIHPFLSDAFGFDGKPLTYTHPFRDSLNGSTTPQGSLDHPCGIAVDSNGYTYLATFGSDRVSVFAPPTFQSQVQYLTQFTPTANGASPCGLAVDSDGIVYVNGRNTDVYRYDPSEYPPTKTTTYGSGTEVDTGNGSTAVAVNSANDHVYVDDSDHVVEYDSAANSNTVLNSAIGSGILSDSYGLDVYGKTGEVYVGDASTDQVYVLNPAGTAVVQAIDGTSVPSFPAGFGSLQGQGLAVDQSNGHVFAADVKDHAVVDEFTPSGAYVDQLAHSLVDSDPTDVVVDNSGGVFSDYVYVTSGAGPGGQLIWFRAQAANGLSDSIANLAIDQAKHRLYVRGRIGGTDSISAFDISTPGAHTPLGGKFPISGTGVSGAVDFAVDQTDSPSSTAGNIYAVSDFGAGADSIYGWAADGTPLNAASGWPTFPLPYYKKVGKDYVEGDSDTEAGGAGVDPDGNVWVGNYYLCGPVLGHPTGEVDEYSALTGQRLSYVDTHNQGDLQHAKSLGCAKHPDFDSNGDLYVAFGVGASSGTTAGVWKYPAATNYTTASRIDSQSAQDVSVDRSTHIVYSVHGFLDAGGTDVATPGVDAYDSGGGLFEHFATDVPFVFPASGTTIKTPGVTNMLSGVAIDQSTGTVYVADRSSGGRVLVFRGVSVPTVGAAANITKSAAKINGHLNPQANPAFSDCRVEYVAEAIFQSSGYSDLSGPGSALAGTKACNGSPPYGATYVDADLDGLKYGTTFHYRLVATNTSGTVRGSDHTFATDPAAYGVQTDEPSDLTQTTATLNGSFTGDDHPATYRFQWGTDTSYGHDTPELSAPFDTGTVSVSDSIANLATYESNSEPYHYRVVVTNDVGTTYGPDRTFFTLPPEPPQISAIAASGISPTAATLSALVDPNLGATIFKFEYGTNPSYGSITPASHSIGNDDAEHPVSATLTGLTSATIYHYRAVATNFGGTSFGPDRTFTTPDVPRVDSASASAIGATTAHLAAQVTPNAALTGVHFEYGVSRAYGNSTTETPIGSGLSDEESGADLSGLTSNTTYHYRVVATNGIGVARGPDQAFTTLPAHSTGQPPGPRPCKKGFVRRHGVCVKRHKHHRHHRHRRNGHA